MKKMKVMKRHLIYPLLGLLLLPACNKALDLRPNGTTSMDKVFTDHNKTRGYLNSCYQFLPLASLDAGSFTDDAQNSNEVTAGSKYAFWYSGGLSADNFKPNNYDGSPWAELYQGVRRCNVFLANIDAATGVESESQRAGFKAQALTLRAFYYINIAKRYGAAPLLLAELPKDYGYEADVRTPVGQILRQVIADCDAAIATPDSEDFSYALISGQWKMMTKAVAQAIRSEAAMMAVSPLFGDGTLAPSEAVAIAGDALSALLANDYALWTEASESYSAYASYFLYNPNDMRSKDKETIYGGERANVWQSNGIPFVTGMSSAGACPTQDLVDAYEMANGEVAITGYEDADHLRPIVNPASGYKESAPYAGRDPRFYATVFYEGSKRGTKSVYTYVGNLSGLLETSARNTHTGYYMRKYASDKSSLQANSDGYVRTYRLAEVYLNFAEVAYQALGPDTVEPVSGLSARDAVNAVRARAGMPELPSGLSAEDFQKRYRNERRVEFALEADRYFSLRRWKVLSDHPFVTGMRITREGSSSAMQRFRFPDRPTAAEKYLLYPIDPTEQAKMQEHTGASWQNPGWE